MDKRISLTELLVNSGRDILLYITVGYFLQSRHQDPSYSFKEIPLSQMVIMDKFMRDTIKNLIEQ